MSLVKDENSAKSREVPSPVKCQGVRFKCKSVKVPKYRLLFCTSSVIPSPFPHNSGTLIGAEPMGVD